MRLPRGRRLLARFCSFSERILVKSVALYTRFWSGLVPALGARTELLFVHHNF